MHCDESSCYINRKHYKKHETQVELFEQGTLQEMYP